MKLENQLCSLELSKELDRLGVKKESYFRWFKCNDDSYKLGINEISASGISAWAPVQLTLKYGVPHGFAVGLALKGLGIIK